MATIRDENGSVYSMEYCPTCDNPGPHQLRDPGNENVFQCDRCFMGFNDNLP